MFNLPLTAGERPLFSALPLVENAYRNQKIFNNMFDSILEKDIFLSITELHVMAALLKKREFIQKKNMSKDLFDLLKKLPLFFNEKQVHDWEVKKIWMAKDFLPYQEMGMTYENLFNISKPSDLYQVQNPDIESIWSYWFEQIPIHDLINILENSAERLLVWNNQRTDTSALKSNISNISKKINLTPTDANAWYYFQTLGHQSSNIWNLYLKENHHSNNYYDLISLWEKALKLPSNFLNSTIYPDSQFYSLGIFKKTNETFDDWNDYWNKISTFDIPALSTRLLNSKNILNLFLKPMYETTIPIDFFDYLDNFNNIINIIQNMKKGKILIYGEKFTGKHTFIVSALTHLRYQGYYPNSIQIDSSNTDQNDKQKHKSQLFLADKIISKIKDTALIINHADNNYDFSDENLYQPSQSLQIWTINDLKDVNKDFLKSFDLILKMDIPPIKKRISIAEKNFPDSAVALKVAQSIKDFHSIIKISQLCKISQDFSWKNASMFINNLQKPLTKSKDVINLNKLDIEENIPKLVGYPNLIEELNKLISFYKQPEKYTKMGAKNNKGILLVGPPGTGKTHFAKNLSKMTNIPLFAPDTSLLSKKIELIEQLFQELKSHAPCILFLDEIDSLIQNPTFLGIADLEKQKIVNAFLTQIDGVNNNEGILIIGATHRDNNFDPASTRSGRLNKIIHTTLPNEEDRIAIWKEHLKNKPLSSSITDKQLCDLSIGFSGADIMESINKAAIYAVENQKQEIDLQCLVVSCDEVFWGYADTSIKVNPHELLKTAYHEAGHALLALYYGYRVPRITIRPRKNSLGATYLLNEEGIFNMSQEDIKKHIQIMLAGLCAEKIQFSYFENGGSSDLMVTHKLLRQAICQSGLGSLGIMHFGDPKLWSNERRLSVENEEKAWIDELLMKTEEIINLNKRLLDEIAQDLVTHKELSGELIHSYKEKVLEPQLSIKQTNFQEQRTLHEDLEKDSSQFVKSNKS